MPPPKAGPGMTHHAFSYHGEPHAIELPSNASDVDVRNAINHEVGNIKQRESYDRITTGLYKGLDTFFMGAPDLTQAAARVVTGQDKNMDTALATVRARNQISGEVHPTAAGVGTVGGLLASGWRGPLKGFTEAGLSMLPREVATGLRGAQARAVASGAGMVGYGETESELNKGKTTQPWLPFSTGAAFSMGGEGLGNLIGKYIKPYSELGLKTIQNIVDKSGYTIDQVRAAFSGESPKVLADLFNKKLLDPTMRQVAASEGGPVALRQTQEALSGRGSGPAAQQRATDIVKDTVGSTEPPPPTAQREGVFENTVVRGKGKNQKTVVVPTVVDSSKLSHEHITDEDRPQAVKDIVQESRNAYTEKYNDMDNTTGVPKGWPDPYQGVDSDMTLDQHDWMQRQFQTRAQTMTANDAAGADTAQNFANDHLAYLLKEFPKYGDYLDAKAADALAQARAVTNSNILDTLKTKGANAVSAVPPEGAIDPAGYTRRIKEEQAVAGPSPITPDVEPAKFEWDWNPAKLASNAWGVTQAASRQAEAQAALPLLSDSDMPSIMKTIDKLVANGENKAALSFAGATAGQMAGGATVNAEGTRNPNTLVAPPGPEYTQP